MVVAGGKQVGDDAGGGMRGRWRTGSSRDEGGICQRGVASCSSGDVVNGLWKRGQ